MTLHRSLLAAALSTLIALPGAWAATPAALAGRTDHGAAVDLAAYKGKVVVLFFWSTECAVCLDLLPEMRSNLKGWKGQDFAIVAVNQDHAMADLQSYLKVLDQVAPPNDQMKIVWRRDPAYRDSFGELPMKEPTTVVIDRQGQVVRTITGRAPAQLWDDIADLVLNCATCH